MLPAILGDLCQQRAEGVLYLEQNDGSRRIHLASGIITFLQSDVAGEQFGNYLLRQGILDYGSLTQLLANEERFRLGDKVVQWGLMTVAERDLHLRSLQEQVMIHALEHPIIQMDWRPGKIERQLCDDLRFEVDHRQFIWATFLEAHNGEAICDLLYQERDWRWAAQADLLSAVSDLPLTPQLAYAISFLGREPIGFETFLSLSGLEEDLAANLLLSLWVIGGIRLVQGRVESLVQPEPEPEPAPPLQAQPVSIPLAPIPPPPLELTPPIELDSRPELEEPEAETLHGVPGIPSMPALEAPSPEENPAVKARKLCLRAKNLLGQDRTVEAIRLLEQSVKLDPDSDQAYEPWLLLGKHRMVNPAWSSRAIEALQSASRLKPRQVEPWTLMGEVYHRKGFTANAKACFRKAVALDPTVPVPDDLQLADDPAPQEESSGGGLFSRFRSILGKD